MAKCVVLISSTPYSEEGQHLLRRLIDEKIELLAVVGIDCEGWEDAMDWLCIELATNGSIPDAFCNTTAHRNESVDEVLEFAKLWNQPQGETNAVEVLRV